MRISRKTKLLIGVFLVIGIFVGILASVGSENFIYYQTPSEVLQFPEKFQNREIRVMGLVEKGSIKWEPRNMKLLFRMSDDSKNFLPVKYTGSKPDMFKEERGVVVEGLITSSGVFAASNLLVKHNEEYRAEKHVQNKEDYYRTLKD